MSVTGSILTRVMTALNGVFVFTNIPAGEYEIVANKGVDESRQRLYCMQGMNTVTLRLNVATKAPQGSGDTISVKALGVPEKARDLLHKAQEAFQKNKLQDALKEAEKALAVAPSYSEALTLRGILRVNNGDRTGGEKDFQASIQSDSNYARAYFAMGALQNVDGQFAEAQRTLEQGLRVEPTSWRGYFELSKAMLGQADYRSALKDIVRVESLGAKYAPIYLVKAHALLGLKFYGEAATEFEHYLQLDPGSPSAAEARKSLQAAKSYAEMAGN